MYDCAGKVMEGSEKEKNSAAIERSYVPYVPKSEQVRDGETEKPTNNFNTEIIMKPKETPAAAADQQTARNEASSSVADMIKKAATVALGETTPQLDDDECLRKVEEMAKARAALPRKITAIKMF